MRFEKGKYPPAIGSDIAVRIRSAPDLTSFLDYCVLQQPPSNVEPDVNTSFDYEVLLHKWGASRKG